MKKFIAIGIVVVLLIATALLLWHVETAKEADAKTFRKLIGDWATHDAEGFHHVITIKTNNSFICSVSANNRGLLYSYQGQFRVKNGFLIETVTNHSDTNIHLPFTSRIKLIRLNSENFIVKTDETTNQFNRLHWIK